MPQVAVRLDNEEIAALDGLVAAGRFPSRADAVRAALAAQRRAEQDRSIAAAYARGYGHAPTTQDDSDLAVTAASLVPDLFDDGGFDPSDLGEPTYLGEPAAAPASSSPARSSPRSPSAKR